MKIKIIKEDKIPGGLSDNLSLEDLSKKHNVSIDYLKTIRVRNKSRK
jgi:hypothetical protein